MVSVLLPEIWEEGADRLGAEAWKLPCEADALWPENPPCDAPCWAQAGSEIPTTINATAARHFMPSYYACLGKMDKDWRTGGASLDWRAILQREGQELNRWTFCWLGRTPSGMAL
jgi:hypothetical protein